MFKIRKYCYLLFYPPTPDPFPQREGEIAWAAAHDKQGRLQSVGHNHYARMRNDSHTKPLHDATVQMAVDAQTQRHNRLTACIGATPQTPFM